MSNINILVILTATSAKAIGYVDNTIGEGDKALKCLHACINATESTIIYYYGTQMGTLIWYVFLD